MIQIIPLTKGYNAEASNLIKSGLSEYFETYASHYNPDLIDPYQHYNDKNSVFLIGLIDNSIIATGALIKEEETIGRIVRMSVSKEYRNQGYASKILRKLEEIALDKGYRKILLETTRTWNNAIRFYKSNQYKTKYIDHADVHFEKKL